MQSVGIVSEAEMVAIFLQAEINSPRFQDRILPILQRDGLDRRIIDHPDFMNSRENACRKQLLGESRGYQRDKRLFSSFPNDVQWERVILTYIDIAAVKYINYPDWIDLSGGSRKVLDAVEQICQGAEVEGQLNRHFWEAAEAVQRGERLPEMIFVRSTVESELIVLEGHLRVSAYLLVPEYLPEKLTALVGTSAKIVNWRFY